LELIFWKTSWSSWSLPLISLLDSLHIFCATYVRSFILLTCSRASKILGCFAFLVVAFGCF
jgi:hypothetical protein